MPTCRISGAMAAELLTPLALPGRHFGRFVRTEVFVAAADGSDRRDLGEGIPGGWLEGGGAVSILRLQGETSSGDASRNNITGWRPLF